MTGLVNGREGATWAGESVGLARWGDAIQVEAKSAGGAAKELLVPM